jgi:hypothetical protein
MRDLSHLLFDLNGGENCLKLYFTHFFARRLILPKLDWNNEKLTPETLISYLETVVNAVCKECNDIVHKVFPYPSHVATLLISRVRDIHFQSAIESSLQHCDRYPQHSHHHELYLQLLHSSFQFLTRVMNNEFKRVVPNLTQETLIDPLFGVYREQQYIKREILSMSATFAETSTAFTTSYPTTKTTTTSLSSYVPITGDLLLPFFMRLELSIARALTLSLPDMM